MNEDSMLHKLGRAISRARKIKELSQITLAKVSQTSPMTIQRLERGRGGGIGFESLVNIAKALDTSLSDLLFEVEKGQEETKKSDFRLENLINRINRFNPMHREWIVKVVEEILDRP